MLAALIFVSACCLSACGEKEPDAYTTGIEALEGGDYVTAETAFQQAVHNDGRVVEGYRGLGITYLKEGKYQEAISMLSECLDSIRSPKLNRDFEEDVLYYQAQAYVGNNQSDKALTIYSNLIDGNNAGRAYLLRGKIYAADGKFGQAGQDFRRAVTRDPSYENYLQIYDVYVANNRQADGAAFLKEALDNSPKNFDDYYQLGRICYDLQDYEKAISYLNKATNANVEGAFALLGKTYLSSGDVDGARKVYEKCIKKGADPAVGYNGLAICDIVEGKLDSALSNIEQGLAVENCTVQEELLFNQIVVYEKQLDFYGAYRAMVTFMEQYPGNEKAAREFVFLKSRTGNADPGVIATPTPTPTPEPTPTPTPEPTPEVTEDAGDTADGSEQAEGSDAAAEGESEGDAAEDSGESTEDGSGESMDDGSADEYSEEYSEDYGDGYYDESYEEAYEG